MDTRKAKLLFVFFLTLVRFPLVLIFFAGAIVNSIYPDELLYNVVLTILMVAAITDSFDGYLARKWNVATGLGAQVDPLMDKFFYLGTWPVLVFVATRNHHIPHAIALLVFTVIFLSRDQWVTFLRSIGSVYNVPGSANWSGKLRTIINFPVICAIYHFEEAPVQIINPILLYCFEALAFIVNLVSIYTYTKFYWPYLMKSASLAPPKE